jgi:hypothetical protein
MFAACARHVAIAFARQLCSNTPPAQIATLAMKYADELHPKRGDKIMVYKRGIIELIIAGKKTLEIRSRRLRFMLTLYYVVCYVIMLVIICLV